MDEVQQFDDCFDVELNIAKVKQILFVSQNRLLVCHLPNKYTIVEIESRNNIQIIKTGIFPRLIEDLKPYKANWVFFIEGNNLHIFDLMVGQSLCVYSIQKSDIYQDKFKYEYVQEQALVVFYKISILKSTPVTVYYDIHQLSVSDKFERFKKSKVDYQQLRKLSYCEGEVISYQTTGYEIQIMFLESGIMHKINSIFNLYLVEATINKNAISLNFTHQKLESQLVTYQITKKKVRKTERLQIKIDPHVYYNHNKTRSFVYKNCFNHLKGDHFTGIFRIKLAKSTKYLTMLNHILPQGVGVEFWQTVLDLLA